MEELNKKLAAWAGFRNASPLVGRNGWIAPDGSYDLILPDFTQSLDACFAWLVPKLDYIVLEGKYYGKYEATIVSGARTPCVRAKTPALALCLAIKELIDAEKKQDQS